MDLFTLTYMYTKRGKKMKISIIIPVYNVEKHLEKCINSVLSQTFSDFEIILINDGSTDRSGFICDEFAIKDLRIKVIHKENGGPASAVNMGIKASSGDYITFIDSDDWVEEDYLKKLYEAIKTTDSDIAVCDYNRVLYENNLNCHSCQLKERYYKRGKIVSDILPYLILDKNKNKSNLILKCRWAKMYKRELIIKNISFFFEDIKWGEDFLLNLACIPDCNGLVYLRGEYLYNYNYNENSLMNSYNKDFLKEYFIRFEHISHILNKKGIYSEDMMYYQHINCFISAINKIRGMFGKHTFYQIINEIKAVVNYEGIRKFKLISENKLNKQQRVYMFLIRNRLYSLIYILLLYFYKKHKNILKREKNVR